MAEAKEQRPKEEMLSTERIKFDKRNAPMIRPDKATARRQDFSGVNWGLFIFFSLLIEFLIGFLGKGKERRRESCLVLGWGLGAVSGKIVVCYIER